MKASLRDQRFRPNRRSNFSFPMNVSSFTEMRTDVGIDVSHVTSTRMYAQRQESLIPDSWSRWQPNRSKAIRAITSLHLDAIDPLLVFRVRYAIGSILVPFNHDIFGHALIVFVICAVSRCTTHNHSAAHLNIRCRLIQWEHPPRYTLA